MKHTFILLAALSLCSASSYAADITAEEAMAAEFAHELQKQAQIEKLQRESDAAFLKQLEAEILLEEQRLLAEGIITPADIQP